MVMKSLCNEWLTSFSKNDYENVVIGAFGNAELEEPEVSCSSTVTLNFLQLHQSVESVTVISRNTSCVAVTTRFVCLFVVCLMSQQQASVSQGQMCSDNFTCCHTEIEVADQTFYLTQSQYTDTGPTSPSADPISPGTWQGSHWSAHFLVTGMTQPRKNPGASGIRTWDLPLLRRTPYH